MGGELERWLAPFLAKVGHKSRQPMCPLYVAGLIGLGDRKSVHPMAERLGLGTHDRLHYFVSAGTGDTAPLLEELACKADGLLGAEDVVLVVDDTTLSKKGNASVGVAPQYASALGKQANCQTLVSLTLARGEVLVMVGLRSQATVDAAGSVMRSLCCQEVDRAGGEIRRGCYSHIDFRPSWCLGCSVSCRNFVLCFRSRQCW